MPKKRANCLWKDIIVPSLFFWLFGNFMIWILKRRPGSAPHLEEVWDGCGKCAALSAECFWQQDISMDTMIQKITKLRKNITPGFRNWRKPSEKKMDPLCAGNFWVLSRRRMIRSRLTGRRSIIRNDLAGN